MVCDRQAAEPFLGDSYLELYTEVCISEKEKKQPTAKDKQQFIERL